MASNPNPISANWAPYQQFASLSIQLMQQWYELQFRAFRVVAQGSMRNTLDLATQAQSNLRHAIAAQITSFQGVAKRNAENMVQDVPKATNGACESRAEIVPLRALNVSEQAITARASISQARGRVLHLQERQTRTKTYVPRAAVAVPMAVPTCQGPATIDQDMGGG